MHYLTQSFVMKRVRKLRKCRARRPRAYNSSNDSALSPVRSEEENDNFDDDSDAEDEGGKERKKKWGRGKDPIEAAAGADKEVRSRGEIVPVILASRTSFV